MQLRLTKTKRSQFVLRIALLIFMGCIALGVTFFSPKQAHAACDSYRPCGGATERNGAITVNWYYDGGDPNVQSNGVNFYQVR